MFHLRSWRLFDTVILMLVCKVQSSKPSTRAQAEGLRVQNYGENTPIKNLILKLVSKKGFTLIELLVVLAVTAILAVVMLPNFQNFGRRQEVKNVAAEMVSNLRKYQIYALSTQKNPTQVPINTTPKGCFFDGLTPSTTSTVEYYEVVFDIPPTAPPFSYRATLHCLVGDPPVTTPVPLDSIEMPGWLSDMTTNPVCNEPIIRFRPLNQDTVVMCGPAAAPTTYNRMTFTLGSGGIQYNVTVNESGDIFYVEVH